MDSFFTTVDCGFTAMDPFFTAADSFSTTVVSFLTAIGAFVTPSAEQQDVPVEFDGGSVFPFLDTEVVDLLFFSPVPYL